MNRKLERHRNIAEQVWFSKYKHKFGSTLLILSRFVYRRVSLDKSQSTTVGDELKLQSRILQRVSKFNEVALVLDNMALVLVILDQDLSIRSPRVPEAALAAKLSAKSVPALCEVFVSGYMLSFVMLLEFFTQNMKFRIHRFESTDTLAWSFSLRIRITDSVGIDYVIGL